MSDKSEFRNVKILGQDFIVPKNQTPSEDTCLTISLMMQQAFLSLGTFASAKKRRETYQFILGCCDKLLSYDEKHLNSKKTRYSDRQ